MSSWTPQLAADGGSWAQRLADAIAADVASGRLAAGDRLPTQRALAQVLGITTGTVNRGYAIAERSGLISAEVGRGTFVLGASDSGIQSTAIAIARASAIDMAVNYPPGVEAEHALAESLGSTRTAGLLGLAPYEGRPEHRAAGARWLSHVGVSADADRLLVSTSIQHGLAATLAALTAPGDVVLTESLTSPSIKSLAALYRLRLMPVECDAHGMIPDALAEAGRASDARVVYTMPTLHTPTTMTMPRERRQAIAGMLAKHSLVVIEDDPWGFLTAGRLDPLQTYAPEHVVYLTSVSKSLAPGLRVGYVVPPKALHPAIASTLGTMTWAAPLMVDLVSRWIEDGTAQSIAVARRKIAIHRVRVATSILGEGAAPSFTPSYHIWLPLPEPWRADEFVDQAATLGVSLAPTALFVPGRAPAPHAVRVSIGTEPDRDRYYTGLRTLATMLASQPMVALSRSLH